MDQSAVMSSHRKPPSMSASMSHELNAQYMAQVDRAAAATRSSLPRLTVTAAPLTAHTSRVLPPQLSPRKPFHAVAPQLQAPGAQWRRGPRDPSGALVPLSERPILCGDVDVASGIAVLGGADHVVYVVDSHTGTQRRMHAGPVSHTEWVVAVANLGGDTFVTAAMDGRLILWNAVSRAVHGRRVPAVALTGHFGSVSAVVSCRFSGNAAAAVLSAGYDKTVRLWTHSAQLAVYQGHSAPVTSLLAPSGPTDGRAASGDRGGGVKLWDLASEVSHATLTGHAGHVTSLAWLPASGDSSEVAPQLLLSGGQDGRLRVWDLRARSCVANVGVHVSEKGAGAIGDIAVAPPCALRPHALIITAGADGAVVVLDPRAGFEPRHVFATHRSEFIYSLRLRGGLALSGDGSGALMCHDIDAGRPLWGIGANEAAVRVTLVTGEDALLVAGDDGKCITYDFSDESAQ